MAANHTLPSPPPRTFRDNDVALAVWTVGSPLLLAVGTVGNVLSVLVLCRPRLRKTTTMFYLAVLAIADLAVLYTGLLRLYLDNVHNFYLRLESDVACKLHTFLVYFCLDLSVWLLVAVTADRCLCVSRPLAARRLSTLRHARWVVAVICVVLALVNGHYLWTVTVTYNGDTPLAGDDLFNCYTSNKPHEAFFVEKIWPWIDLCVVCLVPFVVMATCNSLIVRQIVVSARNLRAHADKGSGIKAGRGQGQQTRRDLDPEDSPTRNDQDSLKSGNNNADPHPGAEKDGSVRSDGSALTDRTRTAALESASDHTQRKSSPESRGTGNVTERPSLAAGDQLSASARDGISESKDCNRRATAVGHVSLGHAQSLPVPVKSSGGVESRRDLQHETDTTFQKPPAHKRGSTDCDKENAAFVNHTACEIPQGDLQAEVLRKIFSRQSNDKGLQLDVNHTTSSSRLDNETGQVRVISQELTRLRNEQGFSRHQHNEELHSQQKTSQDSDPDLRLPYSYIDSGLHVKLESQKYNIRRRRKSCNSSSDRRGRGPPTPQERDAILTKEDAIKTKEDSTFEKVKEIVQMKENSIRKEKSFVQKQDEDVNTRENGVGEERKSDHRLGLSTDHVRQQDQKPSAPAHAAPSRCPVDAQTVPRRCPGDAQTVPRRCPGDAQTVPRRCPGDAQTVPRRCPGDAQTVPRRCPGDAQAVPRRSASTRAVSRRPRQAGVAGVTLMLLTVNTLFMLLTAPIVVFVIGYAYWAPPASPASRASLGLGWAVVNMLQYANNAVHFFLYCLTGPKFRRELTDMCSSPPRRRSRRVHSNRH